MQAIAWEPSTGARRTASEEPVGLLQQEGCDATPSADGSGVIWFSDTTGNEAGSYVVQPWDGGEPQPLLPDVPEGWYSGLAVGLRTVVMAMGYDDGFTVFVSRDGEPARTIHRHEEELRIPTPEWGGYNNAGLSADESLVVIAHAESGSILSYALRAYDVITGQAVGGLDDDGADLFACAWSPVLGDQRLAIRQERGNGFRMPGLWDVATGERTDLVVDLAGEVDVFAWWPDAAALLLHQFHDGTSQLWRYELETGALQRVEHEPGCVWGAQVRPDGTVWLCHDSGARATRILSSAGDEPYVPTADPDALVTGRPFETFEFTNRSGERIQGFVVTPEGEGPWPFVQDIHGGPAWFWGDYWAPKVQALVDAGYAVGLVNYRGSAGFGRAFRDRLVRDIGYPETEDLLDATDHLVAIGIADPDRLVIAGKSWGGYLTLLGVGMHPGRWVAGVADVPVGDYVAAYEDSSPSLQAMDRAYLGAPPAEIPEFITPRSPLTYVADVACPVFIIYGENDTRCPPRQVENYVNAMRAAGGDPEVHVYGSGHSSMVVDEETAHIQLVLDFLAKHVPG